MFHVKQGAVPTLPKGYVLSLPKGRVLALLGLILLSLLALACGGAAGSRGWAAPVPSDDALIVSTGKGRLDALDPQTLEGIWRFPNFWKLPSRAERLAGIYGAPVIDSDGVVYVGDYNGYVYAFRPADLPNVEVLTGEDRPPAAAFKLEDAIIGGVVLDEASGTLFVAAGRNLYAIRASDLVARIENEKASVGLNVVFKTGGDIWAAPLLDDGKLFVASLDGSLYAVDARSGSELWRFTASGGLVTTPVLAGDLLLVGGLDSRLHAIDLGGGDERWSFTAANWVWSRPLVDGGRVYFGDFDGNLYAVDVDRGQELWRLSLGKGPIRAAPALVDGRLIVATEEGWLFGVEPSGQRSWLKEVPGASLNADLVASDDAVLIAPSGCSKPVGASEKLYYASVDPQTGELRSASGVC